MMVFRGFRFKRAYTWMHRMDPRIKLLLSCSFCLVFLYTELVPLILTLAIQIAMVLSVHISHEWLGTLKGGGLFAVLIFVMNLITGSTVSFAIAMVLRFLVLISAFSMFFLTTRPDDLGAALEKMRVPYEYSFMFTTAVRYVPVLATEALTIVDAQRSRGLEMDKGNIMKRVRNFTPVLIPLLVNSIRRSLEMAEAMEARAWGATKKRTSLSVPKLKRVDFISSAVICITVIFAVYARLYLPIPTVELIPWFHIKIL